MPHKLTREQRKLIEQFNSAPSDVITATVRTLRDTNRPDAAAWGIGFEAGNEARKICECRRCRTDE